jgi:hypothetical protein
MSKNTRIIHSISEITDDLPAITAKMLAEPSGKLTGLAGFDGFIDIFIRFEMPSTMAELGPKITAAAGIAASYPVQHLGDKFGGNGPLFTSALHGIHNGAIDLTYIGAMGRDAILPIYKVALESKTTQLYSLADPAHSECLEFDDGKIMLGDLRSCAEITWDRLLSCVGEEKLNDLLQSSHFIGAVNWGKLPHVGEIWKQLAIRLKTLGRTPKSIPFFMDLAEFEQRPRKDVETLLAMMPEITSQCHTLLSFNLKEAWQMSDFLGGNFNGKKTPDSVAELATFLKLHIAVDRIIIHPNDGAACASEKTTVYLPGPVCKKPLISTGAGDHFGAGCLSASLLGLDELGLLLCGVCASGYFVRSGNSPTFKNMIELIDSWQHHKLPERL